jgi:hypothetical protein
MTTAQRLSADRMIEAKGQAVTLTRRASGPYDPATGSAAITETTQTGKGVILDFADGLRKIAGTNIPAVARQCFLSALNDNGSPLTRPAVDDKLTDASGVVYTVTAVSELSPAGTDILYTLTIEAAK